MFGDWSGDASGNANPQTLTMNSDKSVTATFGQPPVIAAQPQSVDAETGQNVTFEVGAQGSPPLAYEWQKNGVALSTAVNATLTLSNVQTADVGEYRALVSNRMGV